MRSPCRVACYVFAGLAAAPAVAASPPKVPAAAPLARCREAENLVARGLALEFEAPCHAECLRQKAYFYGRAVALCPTNAAAQNNLGNLFEAAGQLDDAKERYRRALAAGHDFAPALFGLGDITRPDQVRVTVRWPSGAVQPVPLLGLNRYVAVVEGRG